MNYNGKGNMSFYRTEHKHFIADFRWCWPNGSLISLVVSWMPCCYHCPLSVRTWYNPLNVLPGSQQPQAQLQALSLKLLFWHSAAQGTDGQGAAFLQGSWELLHKSSQKAPGGFCLLHPAGCSRLFLGEVRAQRSQEDTTESRGFELAGRNQSAL